VDARRGFEDIDEVLFTRTIPPTVGGEKTRLVDETPRLHPLDVAIVGTRSGGSETRAIGQFGGGIEVRITPHIGWINDFSWNVVDGPNNNFGMVRTGVNFAF
jgi:hypothetical protein